MLQLKNNLIFIGKFVICTLQDLRIIVCNALNMIVYILPALCHHSHDAWQIFTETVLKL